VLNNIEANSLGKGTALADGDQVTLTHVDEAGGAVDSHVLVSLLESSVFGDVLQVVSAHNDGSLHLGGDDHGLQDTAADGHVAGEGALLVNVDTLGSLLGGLEAKTNALHVALDLVGLLAKNTLLANEDSILLLVGLLVL
jgi:hypothetical protein